MVHHHGPSPWSITTVHHHSQSPQEPSSSVAKPPPENSDGGIAHLSDLKAHIHHTHTPPYFGSFFLPAFKLSKFKIVLNTSGYVPIVSPR
jgi:hypothetical protein